LGELFFGQVTLGWTQLALTDVNVVVEGVTT
jgi:hypothetical protein